MTPRPYDPAEPLGPGRTVVEASAGTGKTFTIAAALTRLVAVEGLDLEEILVVTFTRAATAELRHRVRSRMVVTLRALRGDLPKDIDEHLEPLLAAEATDREAMAGRLDAALTRYDRAQIFTIHGFAARLLAQLGLRARLSPDLEPEEIDETLLAEVAGDLVVGRFAADATGFLEPGVVAMLGGAVMAVADARIVPDAAAVTGLARTRVEMTTAMQAEVRRRMTLAGTGTWDDGLVEVADALADPEIGAAARALLHRRYTIALVDEAQDTDPIQWEVIRAVFDPARLVVIGDPKQSIYSFRGADVESYLAAVDGAGALRTLDVNHRSDGPLVTALDVLFTGATFGDDRIAYHRVCASDEHLGARIHGVAPLSIRRFHQDLPVRRYRPGGPYYTGSARDMVAADTAAEVVRLLTGGVTVTAGDTARALGPADIAVLCRTRWQVDLVRNQLNRRRVPSVAARAGGVFAAPAAEEWRRFLLAVEHPERSDYVRLAATTLLVGNTVTEVAAFTDEAVLDLQEKVRRWHDLLLAEGVPPLVAAVDRETGLSARVLGQPDGERTMTDLTHIAEEMHAVWRRGRMGSLRAWLEAAIAEARRRAAGSVEEPEERQRRLETDAAAVTVQTIHAAKGLQWPAVLVPFTWDRWVHTPKVPVFHDTAHVAGTGPRRRLIDVGGSEAPGFADHVASAMAEDEAEESRLLYVALTRAEHHLVVWLLEDAPKAADNALTGLITAGGRDPALLPATSEGTIELAVLREPPPVDLYVAAGEEPVALSLARFTRPLDHEWRRVSFSSLSPEHPLTASTDADDELTRTDEADVADDEPAAPALALPMAELPRGARFGTLVHEILERTAFDDPVLELALGTAIETARTGVPGDLDAVSLVSALVTAIHTPLGPGPDAVRLRDLAGSRLLKELSFELPVRTGSEAMTLGDIGAVMLDHLPAGDRFRAYAAHLESLAPNRFRGYLTGSIDLTAALPGPSGRHFVVMDFKSNALPTVGATARPEDYGPGPMATAMIEGDYVLQATLYQVALHRYLQWRLPGYDPSVHLGGSRYLFVRGMAGADAPVVDGERCGVSRWAPPPDMIVALSHLFRGARP